METICLLCGSKFIANGTKRKFCNHSCSAKFNNKNRIVIESSKIKRAETWSRNRSEAIKKMWASGHMKT